MIIIDFILSLILFCVVIGIFMRLGRIETILSKTAKYKGAIRDESEDRPKYDVLHDRYE
jgi:hypothetical protein